MSRKLAGALAETLGCGAALLGLLPKAPGRDARRMALDGSRAARRGVVDAALESRMRGAMRSAPLVFEANLGQTDQRVKFTARGGRRPPADAAMRWASRKLPRGSIPST